MEPARCSSLHSSRRFAALKLSGVAAALALLVAGCNESASDKISTDRIVLSGDLLVNGSSVKLKTTLGKENSSVVVVLEGGDSLHATDGSSDQRMDYVADIFGSYYRATFPLNMSATYSVTLHRAADNSQAQSSFPALPSAYTITAPVANSTLSVGASPFVAVTWDAAISADDVAHDVGVSCDWTVAPGPMGASSAIISRSNGHYDPLSTTERNQRRRDVNLAAFINAQRSDLLIDNPGSSVNLILCEATFSIYAKNRGNAGAGLSPYSAMTSRREANTTIRVLP